MKTPFGEYGAFLLEVCCRGMIALPILELIRAELPQQFAVAMLICLFFSLVLLLVSWRACLSYCVSLYARAIREGWRGRAVWTGLLL